MILEDMESPEPQAQWYVNVGGRVFGPADKATLAQWAREGRVPPHAQVAPPGSQAWTPLAAVPELRDLVDTRRSIHTGAPLPPKGDPVGSCPFCAGAVTNEAPSYGFMFGVMEKSILPRLRCTQCGASLKIEQLPEPGQSKVRQTRNRTLAVWIAIVVVCLPVLGYLLWRF
jgi:hypothetical protein